MDELDAAFRSYLSESVTFEHHPERPDTPWKFEIKDEPLPEFSLVIGDAVQNMRSALDYLVYELARHALAGKRLRKRTQFPISTSGIKYFQRGRYQVRPLFGEHRRRIRKLQPYQAKGDPRSQPLALLNRLSNTDKHRLLLTLVNQAGAISMNLKVEDGRPIVVGTEAIALPSYLKETEVPDQIKRRNPDLGAILWLELNFIDEGVPVIDTLNRILGTVTEIIDGFEPVF
jgi:hypothetical protein